MKINSASIAMQGSSSSVKIRSSQTSAEMINASRGVSLDSAVLSTRFVSTSSSVDLGSWRAYTPDGRPAQNQAKGRKDSEELQGWEKENLESLLEEAEDEQAKSTKTPVVEKAHSYKGMDVGDKYSFRMKMLSSLIEAMFGHSHFKQLSINDLIDRSLKGTAPQSYGKNGAAISFSASISGSFSMQAGASVSGESLGNVRRFNVTRTDSLATATMVSFSAQGCVQTTDGRSINLNLNFNVSQQISKSLSVSFERITHDPLVIDFAGNLTQFEGSTMTFDIDCDGEDDRLHNLKAGSGYLAIDRNDNGKVDDGSELFGPETDNGYSELAVYDEDHNGWIDENDSIFSKLRIWYRDENGGSHLDAIVDMGVGAVYLGHASTNYDMYTNDAASNFAGKMRDSGFVLMENGEARLMHELDISV